MCDDMCDGSNCKDDSGCLCPARGIIETVSKKWTMCIISLLEDEKPIRYNEIKSALGVISPKSLSDILKLLEKEGLIERKVYPETPPRVEYSLTDEGKELKIALLPLVEWVRGKEVE
ncbi:MAG: helix-turn-helix domain-containing protein [Halobacteriota archaeon]|nr:helix-turn-helix domain-containing protein [Halobacteriota archaeon]